MAYTTVNKSTNFFDTKLYAGSSGSVTVSGLEFQPDWIWLKNRSASDNHVAVDSVRSYASYGYKNLYPNLSSAEYIPASGNASVTSIGSNSFVVGGNGNTNGNGENFVSWSWKAGSSVSGNTGGSGTAKTYSGSVNTTSGFSIINFVGNGTAGHTIPHHLGAAPKMVIVKNRTSDSTNWQTYHYKLDNGAGTHEIFLDSDGTKNASAGAWNDTAPNSTVVTKGNGSYGNENDSNHIMYSFAEIDGFSKFGAFTGNGQSNNGPFVYTGFKPAFVMIKDTSVNWHWRINDSTRDTVNTDINRLLYPSANAAEGSGEKDMDLLSNGFKVRGGNTSNQSASVIIYAAFASAPFVGTNNTPATAR